MGLSASTALSSSGGLWRGVSSLWGGASGLVRAEGGGGGGQLAAQARIALTSSNAAYPPTLNYSLPPVAPLAGQEGINGYQLIIQTITRSGATEPNWTTPTTNVTVTLTNNLAANAAAINAALAGISAGQNYISAILSNGAGLQGPRSNVILHGTSEAPALAGGQTSTFTVNSLSQLARRISFAQPVHPFITGRDLGAFDMFPVKPNGQTATAAERPLYDYAVQWELRWLADAPKDWANPTDHAQVNSTPNNIYEFGFDLLGANGAISTVGGLSVEVLFVDVTGPVWSSGSSIYAFAGEALAHTLVAVDATDPSSPTYAIAGGANAAEFEISGGSTLRFLSNGTRSLGSGPYAVNVTATDNVGNSTVRAHTVTVIEGIAAASHVTRSSRPGQNIAYAASSATFTSYDIGADVPLRLCVISISNSDYPPTSVSINGVAATKVVGTNEYATMWAARCSGTTATVVINLPGIVAVVGCVVDTILTSSTTTTATAEQVYGFDISKSAAINTPANGITLVHFISQTTNVPSWTNATSVTPNGDVPFPALMHGAVRLGASSNTITATQASGTNMGIVAVSWNK